MKVVMWLCTLVSIGTVAAFSGHSSDEHIVSNSELDSVEHGNEIGGEQE